MLRETKSTQIMTSGMAAWGALVTHSPVNLVKINKKQPLVPLEMALRENSKWRNIYSKKPMKIH